MKTMPVLKKVGVILGGLVSGIAALMLMAASKPAPKSVDVSKAGVTAVVTELSEVSFIPSIIGYGELQPADVITVASEVSGRVQWIHPDLAKGVAFDQDTMVLRLDKTDLELSLIQAQSSLAAAELQKQQMLLEQENTKSNYQYTKERFDIVKSELERREQLFAQGSISSVDLDQQRQSFLSIQTELQGQELALSLLPTNLQRQETEIRRLQSTVAQSQRNLNRAEIFVTAKGRVGDVQVSEGSFVAIGSPLFSYSSRDSYEVEVKVTPPIFFSMFGPEVSLDNAIARVKPARVKNFEGWAAKPLRLSEGFDSTTRMLSIVVAMEAELPASARGLYVEADIYRQPTSAWVVPRSAIHNGNIYLLDDQNRLVIESVDVSFYQQDFAVLANQPSHKTLITSRLFPAVSGMTVAPTLDTDVMAWVSDSLPTSLPAILK